MSVPITDDFMLCLLRFLKDSEHNKGFQDLCQELAVILNLTDEDKKERLNSGQLRYQNRIGWAKNQLKHAGLIEYTTGKSGVVKITEDGLNFLSRNPDSETLKKYFYKKYSCIAKSNNSNANKINNNDQSFLFLEDKNSPDEKLEDAYNIIRRQLAQDILAKIFDCTPTFFEQLVVDLLVKMGYGGSRQDAGQRIVKTGDGGIDGIIKQDHLGLDNVFIQAKRWQDKVGRPEIQKFVGALQGQRARKGIFITTSSYTKEAEVYVENIDTKVVLIDGEKLAELMIDFDIGVGSVASYVIKRIDTDYFEDI